MLSIVASICFAEICLPPWLNYLVAMTAILVREIDNDGDVCIDEKLFAIFEFSAGYQPYLWVDTFAL